MILLGTTVDFVSSDYNKNIFESKFIFKPDQNFASSCGCGVSFTPNL
jgi:Fe-S cluster assembly iron-binding protein IscA